MAAETKSTSQIFRRMPVGRHPREEEGLERSIGLWQLTAFGVGATVGTGIFFVLTTAAPEAGPAVVFSFLIAGITAGLTALCYAELAGAVPVSGSSYSYAYATLGELAAMVVAACLLLEYGVSASAVAVGWSQYLNSLLNDLFGFQLPHAISAAPGGTDGGVINLPAIILVILCCLLLIRGASESAKVNAIMVCIKIAILVLFIAVAATGWNSDNLSDFAPFGFHGVQVASATIFFSFIGLDAVSTAGDEVKDPERNMPRAIIMALIIVTTLYVAVAITAVAAQHYTDFEGQEAGLAKILENVTGSTWPSILLAGGAVISIFSITLVVMYGQTRILFTMSRDKMLPPLFSKVNRRTMTPIANTIIVAAVVAVVAGFVPLDELMDVVSIGTLVAFMVVSAAVIILRRRDPDLERSFRVPLYPVVPILSILACLYLLKGLQVTTWVVFGIWVSVVVIFYFAYGHRRSTLRDNA